MQSITSKYIYILFVFTLVFGIILHGPIGFEYIDEIAALGLIVLFFTYMFKTPNWEINKAFLITLSIFIFYLVYSFAIKSNAPKAIFTDFIIQLKPYVAFFCIYQMSPKFSSNQKRVLNQLCIISWVLLMILGIGDIFVYKLIIKTMGHPTKFAAAITAVSLTYLYTSNFKWKNKLFFLLMLSVGLISGKAKFYGFFVLATIITFYFSDIKNIKLNFKNIMVILIMIAGIVLVAWQKIMFYFLSSLTGGEENDYLARFVLYGTSFLIFADYFPFGSGLGSFATHASRVVYSNTYSKYNIDSIWGLSKSYDAFIADTYYPSLAQFGVVGVILFFSFWIYILKKAFNYMRLTQDTLVITLVIITTGFLLIENIADATQTSNRGFFIMMFLGVILGEQKAKIEQLTTDTGEQSSKENRAVENQPV